MEAFNRQLLSCSIRLRNLPILSPVQSLAAQEAGQGVIRWDHAGDLRQEPGMNLRMEPWRGPLPLTRSLKAYGRAKAEFGFISNLYSSAQNYGVIYYDVLPKLWSLTGVWMARYAPANYSGEIVHSLIFFFTFNLITTVLGLPVSYYSNFVLEEKFGFNKQTVGLWVADIFKGQALSVALGAPLLSGFLAIIKKTGNSFFYYLWLLAVVVQLFAITIYPIAILPLFNKLTPLPEGPLKTSVEGLAKRLKFPLTNLYVIDGSKRSAHSNAYFFGLPWKKHIVIYDTLIEGSETEEVVAVLGHELGHWSLGHTTKLFGIAQVSFLTNLPWKWCAKFNTSFISSTSSHSSPSSLAITRYTNPLVFTKNSLLSSAPSCFPTSWHH